MRKDKLIVAVINIVLWASVVQAQFPQKIQDIICSARLAPIVGTGFTTVSTEDSYSSYESKLSFLGGVKVPMQISNKVQFIPGAQFETKGAISSYSYEFDDAASNPTNSNARLMATTEVDNFESVNTRSYFSLPWRVGFTPVTELPLQFSVGINNSFLLGSKTRNKSFGTEETMRSTQNITTFNLGLLLGISYQVNAFGVGVLYDHGLNNISKSEFTDLRDRTFRITLSYLLNFNPIFKESYSKAGRGKMKMYQ